MFWEYGEFYEWKNVRTCLEIVKAWGEMRTVVGCNSSGIHFRVHFHARRFVKKKKKINILRNSNGGEFLADITRICKYCPSSWQCSTALTVWSASKCPRELSSFSVATAQRRIRGRWLPHLRLIIQKFIRPTSCNPMQFKWDTKRREFKFTYLTAVFAREIAAGYPFFEIFFRVTLRPSRFHNERSTVRWIRLLLRDSTGISQTYCSLRKSGLSKSLLSHLNLLFRHLRNTYENIMDF